MGAKAKENKDLKGWVICQRTSQNMIKTDRQLKKISL